MPCGVNIQKLEVSFHTSGVGEEHGKPAIRTRESHNENMIVKIYHKRADRQTGQAWVRSFREE